MLRKICYILTLISVTTIFSGYAQSKLPIIDAKFVPDSIAIGDQFELQVTIDKDMVQVVEFPTFDNNKLGEIVEILSEGELDTVSHDGRNIKLSKKYLLTTFEQGYYSFDKLPMLFVDKNIVDTIWSKEPLILQVTTFEIDTTKQVIHDIKLPMGTPLKFGEVSGYVLSGVLVALLIALLVLYIVRRRANRPLFGKREELLPPHILAIKALEELKDKKMWQSDKQKLYYTSLTDILREYLEGRYGIHAMEMISDEIIVALKMSGLSAKNLNEVKELLITSDLVKFAKVQLDADDNESNFNKVYYFVEDTKTIESEIDNKEEVK